MNVRFLVALSFTALFAVPASAQFSFTIQQNGQTLNISSGSSITVNAPALNQAGTAIVTITNTTGSSATFTSGPTITGSSAFSTTTPLSTLAASQSTSFNISYTPTVTTQTVDQFSWPFTIGTGSGTITFTLIGTSANVVVSQITSNGSFQAVPNGGGITFPNTVVNATSSITTVISNTGSGSTSITGVTAGGTGFAVGGVPVLPATLNAGGSLTLSSQFAPPSVGALTGSLSFTYTGGTYSVALAGTGILSSFGYTTTQDGVTSALTPGQTITIDNTAIGSTSSALITFQNTSAAAVSLSTVSISGSGFAIVNSPFLPDTLQPQQSDALTVTYTPTTPGPSSGRLRIGNDSFTLSANALGQLLTFSYQLVGTTVSVTQGGTVSFPSIAVGQSSSVQFTVTNTGTATATISSLGVTGPAGVFAIPNQPTIPVQLAAGATSTFTLTFTPLTVATVAGVLDVNNVGFNLSGTGTTPPALPSYQFTGVSGTQQPFQQPAVGLSLGTPYPVALFGTLTMTIVSNSFVADPAVQFSSGGLKTTFTIPANTLQAVFPNGATQIKLQTGTVAGTIQITPDFTVGSTTGADITPNNPPTVQLIIPTQAPTLLSATVGAQTNAGFSVAVAGFTTTRALQNLTFTLTPTKGSNLSATSFTMDLSAISTVFFPTTAAQAVGGQFIVTVPFSLSQSGANSTTNLTRDISSISVTTTNSVGSSNTLTIPVP